MRGGVREEQRGEVYMWQKGQGGKGVCAGGKEGRGRKGGVHEEKRGGEGRKGGVSEERRGGEGRGVCVERERSMCGKGEMYM